MLRVRLCIGAAVGLALCAAAVRAGERPLTLDAIYDPATRVDFSGRPPTGLTWLDDTSYLWARRGTDGTDWVRVTADTGETTPLLRAADLERALAATPGIDSAAVTAAARGPVQFDSAHEAVLLTVADDLYHYHLASRRVTRLTRAPGQEVEASFSPDGRRVAFVRSQNLFVVDIQRPREQAITKDGAPRVLNGMLDWVYQEELYGRGTFRAYWWSPDSAHLAFLRLDDRQVPVYTLLDQTARHPTPEPVPYPKAGDPNPLVQLGVAPATGGRPTWVDLRAYAGTEILVVAVGWSADSRRLVYEVQDREQTWLDLNVARADGEAPQRLLREKTPAWVDAQPVPVWLPDGTFLWTSDRTGFRHVYRYRPEGTLVGAVTSGRWDVRTLYGADAAGRVYFAGVERSPIGQDLYRVGLDGGGLTRLSQMEGRHRAVFNAARTRYIGYWSNITTPTQVRLHDADGTERRVIDRNDVPAHAEFALQTPEFLQVRARDGFVMEAMMIKPPGFDPARRYPVYQDLYAGPGTQNVLNAWRGPDYLFLQLLAQHGVLVWVLDNRSASGKGAESQWPIYGRLGEVEQQDIDDGVAWLTSQPWVDPARIMLGGWSYGGFQAAYALTHSRRFAGAVIGAPVTDWKNYDSIYTERYMKLPRNNPEGYARTAPALKAAALTGRALIVHGSTDDNVHLQNSEQLVLGLQQAGQSFEMMFYPRATHGVTNPYQRKHLYQLMRDFILKTGGLTPGAPPPAPAP